jgi:hypothetical protein
MPRLSGFLSPASQRVALGLEHNVFALVILSGNEGQNRDILTCKSSSAHGRYVENYPAAR